MPAIDYVAIGPTLSKGTCLGSCGEKKLYMKKRSMIVKKWSIIGTKKKINKEIYRGTSSKDGNFVDNLN